MLHHNFYNWNKYHIYTYGKHEGNYVVMYNANIQLGGYEIYNKQKYYLPREDKNRTPA